MHQSAKIDDICSIYHNNELICSLVCGILDTCLELLDRHICDRKVRVHNANYGQMNPEYHLFPNSEEDMKYIYHYVLRNIYNILLPLE